MRVRVRLVASAGALARLEWALAAPDDPAVAWWTSAHASGATTWVVSPGAVPAIFDAWSRCSLRPRPRFLLVGGPRALGDLDPALVGGWAAAIGLDGAERPLHAPWRLVPDAHRVWIARASPSMPVPPRGPTTALC